MYRVLLGSVEEFSSLSKNMLSVSHAYCKQQKGAKN